MEPKSPVNEELETYKQKIHVLEFKLITAEQEKLTVEDYWKGEVDSQVETIQKLETEKTDLASKAKDFKQKFEECYDELQERIGQLEELQKTNDQLKRLNSKPEVIHNDSFASSKELDTLRTNNETLKLHVKQLEEAVLSQTNSIRDHESKVQALNQYILELKENLDVKNTDIKELKEKLSAQEDMYTHKMMNMANEDMVDNNQRGNSLFSELENRRVKVEEEMNRLRNKVRALTDQNVFLQTKVNRGDKQTSVILTQLSAVQKSQEVVMTEIAKWRNEEMKKFDMYAKRIEKLRDEYQNKLERYVSNTNVTDSKVCQERDQLLVQNLSLQKEIMVLKREIGINQHLRVEAEAKKVIEEVRTNGKEEGSENGTIDSACITRSRKEDNCQQQ